MKHGSDNTVASLASILVIILGVALLTLCAATKPTVAEARQIPPYTQPKGDLFIPLVVGSGLDAADLRPMRDGRYYKMGMHEGERQFWCSEGLGFYVPCYPVTNLTRAKITPYTGEQIYATLLYVPDFYGFQLLIFAIEEGCMWGGGEPMYCIKYYDDRRAALYWTVGGFPPVQGVIIDLGIPDPNQGYQVKSDGMKIGATGDESR